MPPHSLDPDLLQDVLAAASLETLTACVQRVVEDLGFNKFFYLAAVSQPELLASLGQNSIAIGTYPQAWIERYRQQNYHLIDPTALHIKRQRYPVAWRSEMFRTPEAARMYAEARHYGVSAGGTCPIIDGFTNAGFGFARDQDVDEGYPDALRALPHAFLLGAYLHTTLMRLLRINLTGTEALTPREEKCVLQAALGMRDTEIGNELGISTRTVLFHLTNARRKLAADNRAQLIAKAIALGIVRL